MNPARTSRAKDRRRCYSVSKRRSGTLIGALFNRVEVMAYRFFFSYAWDDRGPDADDSARDQKLKNFFHDLAERVAVGLGIPLDEAAYRDRVTNKVGTVWQPALLSALQTSSTLVCLVSPYYRKSEWCGREFEVFRRRIAEYRKQRGGGAPPVILPITWLPVRGTLPPALAELTFANDKFPPEYLAKGLRNLTLSGNTTAYEQFIEVFAGMVMDVSDAFPVIPEAPGIDKLENVIDAFNPPVAVAAPVRSQSLPPILGGPDEVKFVFVAAPGPELRAEKIREDVSPYGDYGGWHWQPFQPPPGKQVGKIAQRVSLDYHYQEVPWIPDPKEYVTYLKNAGSKEEIIVLIIDAWTVRLERYRKFIEEYDSTTVLNSAVIVAYNLSDLETPVGIKSLEDQIRLAFRGKSRQSTDYFYPGVSTPETLEKTLERCITKIRNDITEDRAVRMRIQGPPLPTPPTPGDRQPDVVVSPTAPPSREPGEESN